jgi:hypothetical protein
LKNRYCGSFSPQLFSAHPPLRHYSRNFFEKENSWELPLAPGLLFPVKEGTEILIEVDWTHAMGATWKESERFIAAGFNQKITDNLEFISEAGREFSNKEFIVTVA